MEKRYSLGKIIKISGNGKKIFIREKCYLEITAKKKVMMKEIVSVFRYQ